MVLRTESNSLDCSSFEERIHQLLDDRLTLTGDQRLMNHAEQCADCNSMLEDFDSVDDSIRLLHSDIEAAINERIAEKAADRQTSRLGWVVAFAATMLLFVGMIRSESTHRDKVAVRQAAPKSPKSSMTPRLGVVGLGKTLNASQPVVTKVRVRREAPASSPFSREFSLANHIPSVPTVPSLTEISTKFENLEPVINYSAELPGVRPAQCSWSLTLDLIMKSFIRSNSEKTPDLGLFGRAFHRACA